MIKTCKYSTTFTKNKIFYISHKTRTLLLKSSLLKKILLANILLKKSGYKINTTKMYTLL